jgi:hypothetical protein
MSLANTLEDARVFRQIQRRVIPAISARASPALTDQFYGTDVDGAADYRFSLDQLRGAGGATSVKDAGAVGDGVTDDTAAINTAFVTATEVYFPPGTYLVSDAGSNIALTVPSNIRIRGAGIGVTTIKLANSGDAHVFHGTNVSHVEISHLTIDGNRANQTAGVHGVRGTDASFWNLHDLEIKDTRDYGIGFQDGTMTDIILHNIWMDGTGADGIDFKNADNANASITLSNININNPGTVSATQAGVDLRGEGFTCNNIIVTNLAAGHFGIRFRASTATLEGGRRSSLSGFHISGAGAIGLKVVDEGLMISDGTVDGCVVGVNIDGTANSTPLENILSGVRVVDCTGDGFNIDALATRCRLMACVASSCADEGFRIESDDTSLIGCIAEGNTGFGVEIIAGASNCSMTDMVFSNNTGGAVSDAGTATRARNCLGFVTENNVQTADLAIDSTGSKTFTTAHGLGVTPAVEDCSLTIIENTGVEDWALDHMKIESTTSDNVLGRIVVGTGSGTGGAVVNVGIRCAALR